MDKQNKYVKILLLIILFQLSACSNSLSTKISNDGEKIEIIEEDKFYKVIYQDFMYYYYIYDYNKDLVYSDGPLSRQPHISMVDKYIIKIYIQAGTGISTRATYYYDTENDMFSKIFNGVCDETGDLLVYSEDDKVIVRDIFDEKVYYREFIEFSNEFANVAADFFVQIKFIDDDKKIQVTYLTGEGYEEITEIFYLY